VAYNKASYTRGGGRVPGGSREPARPSSSRRGREGVGGDDWGQPDPALGRVPRLKLDIAAPPKNPLSRSKLKNRGGRSAKSGNQITAGWPLATPLAPCPRRSAFLAMTLARTTPLGLGAHRPVSVPSGMYQGAFAKKNGSADSPPPWWRPPVLGFLVRSAEGLPSTRNWPSRWPLLPATHQPAPGDTQGNVSRQLAGAVVLGGGAAPAPPLAAEGASVRLPFECLRKTRGA
jgi:hypothetical protein